MSGVSALGVKGVCERHIPVAVEVKVKKKPQPDLLSESDIKHLTNQVRRLVGDDAEDVVQEAAERLHARTPSPDAAARYASTTARNLAKNRLRAQRCMVPIEDDIMAGAAVSTDEVERLLELDGALENLIVWGGTGTTRRQVESLQNVNVDAIKEELAFYLAVLDELPRCDRQKRRLRQNFQEALRSELDKKPGYVLSRSWPATARPLAPEGGPAPTERSVSGPGSEGPRGPAPADNDLRVEGVDLPETVLIDDETGLTFHLLNRGATLVRRMISSVEREEIVQIVRRAANRYIARGG